MEELNWEKNISSFPWSNINHHQQEPEEPFTFGSENIFFNPIQNLPKPGSTPTLPSSFGSASQYWQQTINRFQEGNNVISPTTTPVTLFESLDYATSSFDPEEDISLILYNRVYKTKTKTSNDVVSSSDGSVTKHTFDGADNSPRSKKPRSDPGRSTSSTINFQQTTESDVSTDSEVVAEMKKMIYRAAAFRPVSFAGDDVAEKPRRNNVRISNDPQTVAARKRRERISERIRVLQKLVPGGDKMDTASVLDEAANYLKFLRSQVKALEQFGTSGNAYGTSQNVVHNVALGVPFPMHASFLLP